MGVTLVTLIGSVGAGKTTTARTLTRLIQTKKGTTAYYINITVFHGIAYIIISLLSYILQKIERYRFIGNNYLTLWFNNKNILKKIYKLTLLLDILSLALVIIGKIYLRSSLCLVLKRECIILIDEGPITAMAIHYYFSYHFKTTKIFNFYYRIAYAFFYMLTKRWKNILVIFRSPVKLSIEIWQKREKTKIVDVKMILTRYSFENILIRYSLNFPTVTILNFNVTYTSTRSAMINILYKILSVPP